MAADPEVARQYYRCLDAGDYETFSDILAPEVVHHRPDRTFEGRATLVSFMREDRPQMDTTHELEEVFVGETGSEVAVRGRLIDSDGEGLFSFVDVFEFDSEERIQAIYTHTR